MTTAALAGYHLDADAQGQATLAWTGYTRDAKVIRVADIREGRPGRRTELWRGGERVNGALDSFDVSPGGAAVACLRVTRRSSQAWRLQVRRRPPGGVWGKPIRVGLRIRGELTCRIDDAGQMTLAWGLGGAVQTAAITPGGVVQRPVRLAPDSVGSPQLVVTGAGAPTIAFTVGSRNRAVHIAERGPTGWTSRAIAPGMLPYLALDGAGRAAVGWSTGTESGNALRFAAGPAFAPQALLVEPRSTLSGLAAGPRGDMLAAWQTNAWAYSSGPRELRVMLQRPGEPFGAPISLGRFGSYPLELSLAADGTGAAVWNSADFDRATALVIRKLGADGSWSPASPLPGSGVVIAAAPGGRVTAAWTTRTRRGERLHVGLVGT